eukprot:6515905-Alexandrium_andersonii.AAC.1
MCIRDRIDVLLQGVADGRWELRQVRDELLAPLLALAVLDTDDKAALPPMGRAGIGIVYLVRVRRAAGLAGVTAQVALRAVGDLDSPAAWAQGFGEQ